MTIQKEAKHRQPYLLVTPMTKLAILKQKPVEMVPHNTFMM
ncbi:MAG: hypothetical protein ABF649_03275 [Bacillus sp. (in: firmicutes)]